MHDLRLWEFIRSSIESESPVILMTVLNSTGGSPGKAGFKMAVSDKSGLLGTIGGGIMEYDLVEKAKEYLKKKERVRLFQKLYHNRNAKNNQSGLICAGTETIFICSLNSDDLENINFIINAFNDKKSALLKLSPEGVSFIKEKRNGLHIKFEILSEDEWSYEENIGVQNTVYVIGCGHVGLAVSKIMSQLDFYVITFDDRPDVITVKRNNFSHRLIIKNFNEIGNDISEGDYSYVVIVTTAYPSDKKALLQVIDKKVKYIGLMGSAAKIKKIFDEAKAEGVTEEKLRLVHSPIGEKINSNTPEEIAISIAAEIIRIKNTEN